MLDARRASRHKRSVSRETARVAIAVAAAVVVAGVAEVASAADIRWGGDASCRRELEVAEQVRSMIGRDLRLVDDIDFELRPQQGNDGTWRIELDMVRRAGRLRSSRSVEGKSCEEVTDAAAVAIGLALGPEPDRAELQSTPAAPAANVVPNEFAAPDSTHSKALVWFAGVGASLDSSVTPNVALGGALRLGLSWAPSIASRTRLRFELEGALFAPTERTSANGKGGKFQLGYLAPLVCAETPLERNAFIGCVGYELGQLSAEGQGNAVSASRQRATLWYAVRAEVGLLVPVSSGFRAFARSGAALPLVRHEFVLDGSELVFRPPAISFRGQLGLELSF